MRKCGFCRQKREPLALCYVLKEGKPYRGSDIVDIIKGIHVMLCDECKVKEYTKAGKVFKPSIIQENA